jgi:hypothetical protein
MPAFFFDYHNTETLTISLFQFDYTTYKDGNTGIKEQETKNCGTICHGRLCRVEGDLDGEAT